MGPFHARFAHHRNLFSFTSTVCTEFWLKKINGIFRKMSFGLRGEPNLCGKRLMIASPKMSAYMHLTFGTARLVGFKLRTGGRDANSSAVALLLSA